MIGRVSTSGAVLVGLSLMLALTTSPLRSKAQVADESAKPDWSRFKSDGCSMWPDGNYRDCCVEHDKAYFLGGGYKDRAAADRVLVRCVASKGKWYNKAIVPFMWAGVRVGGVGFLPLPFRWGFGNPYPSTRPVEKQKEKKKRAKGK